MVFFEAVRLSELPVKFKNLVQVKIPREKPSLLSLKLPYIDTSKLIWKANQLTGFYMTTLTFNELTNYFVVKLVVTAVEYLKALEYRDTLI